MLSNCQNFNHFIGNHVAEHDDDGSVSTRDKINAVKLADSHNTVWKL